MSNTELSIQEYKKLFDKNNFKKNNYQIALFLQFLMGKDVKVKNIEDLTGIEKSQIFSYKKIVKSNKIDELKTSSFRDVKNLYRPKNSKDTPELEQDLISEIENMSINDPANPVTEPKQSLSRTR